MRLRSFLTFTPSTLLWASLLTVILLVGCAPAPEESQPTTAPLPTATIVQPEAAPTDAPTTQASTETPQAVATSRGPNLEASDPAIVSLNSGDVQFVEFFRFT